MLWKNVTLAIIGSLGLFFAANAGLDRWERGRAAAREVCMREASEMIKRTADANNARASQNIEALNSLSRGSNPAEITAALSGMNTEEQQTTAKQVMAICDKVVSCSPDKPRDKTVTECYAEAMRGWKAYAAP